MKGLLCTRRSQGQGHKGLDKGLKPKTYRDQTGNVNE